MKHSKLYHFIIHSLNYLRQSQHTISNARKKQTPEHEEHRFSNLFEWGYW